jgi:hypothetical protein
MLILKISVTLRGRTTIKALHTQILFINKSFGIIFFCSCVLVQYDQFYNMYDDIAEILLKVALNTITL